MQTLSGETELGKVDRLKVIVDALSDDEWLECIRHWRVNTSVRQIDVGAGVQNHAAPEELDRVNFA